MAVLPPAPAMPPVPEPPPVAAPEVPPFPPAGPASSLVRPPLPAAPAPPDPVAPPEPRLPPMDVLPPVCAVPLVPVPPTPELPPRLPAAPNLPRRRFLHSPLRPSCHRSSRLRQCHRCRPRTGRLMRSHHRFPPVRLSRECCRNPGSSTRRTGNRWRRVPRAPAGQSSSAQVLCLSLPISVSRKRPDGRTFLNMFARFAHGAAGYLPIMDYFPRPRPGHGAHPDVDSTRAPPAQWRQGARMRIPWSGLFSSGTIARSALQLKVLKKSQM